ncbi:transposase [Paenibacillus tarimensis]|uniref:transposase n=1 Tax=Paenibacillus tarimensis TaxID=416012 RepID=UPI001F3AD06F|nr:transposase [Paenibacillus tarimensis]MCF2943050.1 transposase [Paenibacillus tarimensis]
MIPFTVFMKEYGEESNCRRLIERLRWPEGFCCPRCDYAYYYYIGTRGLYQCLECGAQTSVTSGTMMHRTRLPLSYWLYVVYNIAADHVITASELSKVLAVQYRSAYRLLHTARIMMSKLNGIKSLQYITTQRILEVIMPDRLTINLDIEPSYDHIISISGKEFQEEEGAHTKHTATGMADGQLHIDNTATGTADGQLHIDNTATGMADDQLHIDNTAIGTADDQLHAERRAAGSYGQLGREGKPDIRYKTGDVRSRQPAVSIPDWKHAASLAETEPAVQRARNRFIRQAYQFIKGSYGHKVTMRYLPLYCQEYYFRVMRRTSFQIRWNLLLAKLVGIRPAY